MTYWTDPDYQREWLYAMEEAFRHGAVLAMDVSSNDDDTTTWTITLRPPTEQERHGVSDT